MKERFNSVDEILDFAIEREKEAKQFYTELAGRMKNRAMGKVFADFAKEEDGHRAKLEAVKRGDYTMKAGDKAVASLALADYLVDVKPEPRMSYGDALILAMKKEKAAYRLYLDLAAVAGSEELANMFLALANEEAKHKLRFEIEYDDEVLTED